MNVKEILLKLLEFKSVSTNTLELKKIVIFIEDIFKDKKVYIKKFEVNEKPSIYISFYDTLEPRILFLGHLDVVPPDSEVGWSIKEEGDRIFARGAMDMKGTCAVLIKLFLDLIEEKRNGNFALLFTTDEEIGGKDGVEYIVNKENLNPEFVIIPDGGLNFNPVLESKGVLHVEISAKGKSCHGSTPWLGENAIEKLFEIYKEIKEFVIKESENKISEHWHPTVSIGVINGGEAVNKVPDNAFMQIDLRFPYPYSLNYFENKIKEILSKYKDTSYKILSKGEPVYTSSENEYVKKFIQVYEKVLDKKINFIKEHGATDGRFFVERNTPVLIIYPVGGGVHSKDEWVSISSLETLLNLFKEFLKEYEES
ncbi:MAG: M20/M25/M40 family metallo-hydrolase [candidate division WOR-3 bacterium]